MRSTGNGEAGVLDGSFPQVVGCYHQRDVAQCQKTNMERGRDEELWNQADECSDSSHLPARCLPKLQSEFPKGGK